MRQLPSKKCKVRFLKENISDTHKKRTREHSTRAQCAFAGALLLSENICAHIYFTHSISDVLLMGAGVGLSLSRAHTHI